MSNISPAVGPRYSACSQLIRFKQSLELGKANFQVVTVEREKRTVAATCLSNGGNEKQENERTRDDGRGLLEYTRCECRGSDLHHGSSRTHYMTLRECRKHGNSKKGERQHK